MIHWQGSDLYIAFYVQPNASQDKIVGMHNEQLKIQITAPANENKANRHLQQWLAKQFKVPVSAVTLEKGQQSRSKVVCIHAPRLLPPWLDLFTKEE
ncbi:MAG: DUF167 family protein [Candidatus Berkiellales bacterium]